MNAANQSSNGKTLVILLGAMAWSLALIGVLLISRAPGDWGHSLCGPWGCAPPLQALTACHLAWLVLIAPLTVIIARSPRFSARLRRKIGALLCLAAVALLAYVLIDQWLNWLPKVGDWQKNYFLQRCAFVVATSIDLPIIQLLLAGGFLLLPRVGYGAQSSISLDREAKQGPAG